MIAALAMSLSSVSVISNALRLKGIKHKNSLNLQSQAAALVSSNTNASSTSEEIDEPAIKAAFKTTSKTS